MPAHLLRASAHVRDVLYESPTTRVWRQASDGVVCKESLGTTAARRLEHEKGILKRLSGVAGVVKLAAGKFPAEILALQDCGGVALSQRTQGLFPIDRLLGLGIALARSLAALHRAGVLHRDINPANIVLSEEGEPVVIDFDLAVVVDQHAPSVHDGNLVGTLGYLAPEQSGRTGRAVDHRADLYALGATLYELATGQLPFKASDTLQLVRDHLVREPEAPALVDARVPHGLSDIIMRLLAKAPEQRYQSAEGLQHDLSRLREELACGGDGVFELGERDFPALLVAPAALVGRNAEVQMLRGALDQAKGPHRRAVLIEGPPGVGKSALVQQLRPIVQACGGWFVHGKFDQYQKDNAAAGAVTQALRAAGRLLLALPKDELEAQRRRILDRLGRNSGLIARLSPEFGAFLGTQSDAPEVDPRQAELQLQQAIAELIGAIASPEHPVVVVVDDLQWAGPVALRGFQHLMDDPGLRGFLLVGVYRSGEADVGQLLAPMLEKWRGSEFAPLHIALTNLDAADIGALTAQMLRLDSGAAGELAAAMGPLTGGNPFDTVEMINALRRDGVLSMGDAGWRWDERAVRRFVGRGNVVDLLAARIARLPAASRELMERMSCLGNDVELELLGAACALGASELAAQLRAPLEDGLLVAEQGDGRSNVRFRHDRVQQAVLDAMDRMRRSAMQLAMARQLARVPAFGAEAAQQYLASAGRLEESGEKRDTARLFHRTAQMLADTAIYPLADRYLAAATALLQEVQASHEDDPSDAQLRGEVDACRHVVLYGLGQLDDADACYATVQACRRDPLDLVEPACLQMRSLFMRGRTADARELGQGLLTKLGLPVPHDFSAPPFLLHMQRRLDALNEWIAQDSRVDHGSRRQIQDRRLLAIAKLLGRMSRPAYFSADRNAFRWLLLESQRLWADHGPCPELVASLGRMSGMLIGERQDYRTAHAIARHALAVGEALGYDTYTAEARFLLGTLAGHWFEPLEQVLVQLVRAYEEVKSAGDPSYAGYVHAVVISNLLETAPTIDASMQEVDAGIDLCRRTSNIHAAAQHLCERQMLRALCGSTRADDSFDDGEFAEEQFLKQMGRLPNVEHAYAECRAMHALIMGDGPALVRHAGLGMSQLDNVAGYYMTVYAHLFTAMARAWQLRSDPAGGERETWIAELASCSGWLVGRAADQPRNFLHIALLVQAEEAWALGDVAKATTVFDDALVQAEDCRRPWHRAVVTERAGLFHLARGLRHTARRLLAEACVHYEAWGATAKVARMRREHAFLAEPVGRTGEPSYASIGAGQSIKGSNNVSPDALDLMGVLRASQALSSETGLEALAARVTEVLESLSGATRVRVLSWHGDEWWLLAPAPAESPMPLAQATDRGLLPVSALAYAQRLGETLHVDDVTQDDRFARDTYFMDVPVCSVLVVPIANQGVTRAMIYLENRLGRAAFNAQRLDAVMLIAGQLAVSLANAQLYESLEQRVQARTRELEEAQAQLVATARRAGKAEIANNVLHNVGNVLNSVNVSASMLRKAIGNSRLDGLQRAVDLINSHAHELPQFLAGERGKALVAYLNELAATLGAQRDEALGDLDRLASSVDHITYVVATQQSHAGPSSVTENVRPQDVLEEALRLSAETIVQSGVSVVRRYGDVVTAHLDRQRLLQILVNLIANAVQAMHGLPETARRLTLSIDAVSEKGASGLRISVRDEGEGIAQENLTRVFAHGFTTKKDGHGFGLHSSALAAMEMGGRLTVHSDGPGKGAVFALDVPILV